MTRINDEKKKEIIVTDGQGKFENRKVDVRALMVLYPNRMHVVTVEGTGINKVSDLKGKRVSTGAPNSATQIMAYRVLEAYGLDPEKDIIRERAAHVNR